MRPFMFIFVAASVLLLSGCGASASRATLQQDAAKIAIVGGPIKDYRVVKRVDLGSENPKSDLYDTWRLHEDKLLREIKDHKAGIVSIQVPYTAAPTRRFIRPFRDALAWLDVNAEKEGIRVVLYSVDATGLRDGQKGYNHPDHIGDEWKDEEVLLHKLEARGLIFVACTGSSEGEGTGYPASSKYVVGVGWADNDDGNAVKLRRHPNTTQIIASSQRDGTSFAAAKVAMLARRYLRANPKHGRAEFVSYAINNLKKILDRRDRIWYPFLPKTWIPLRRYR